MNLHKGLGAATAAVVALALTACGGGTEDDTGEVPGKTNTAAAMTDYKVGDQFKATEPVTFSLLYSDHPNYPAKDDWLLWKEITARTNVTLENTLVPMSDYGQKRSLLIGAGDAPFIISKTYPGQEAPFVASGAILPVSDYVDLMPNFAQKIEEWDLDDNLDTLRQEDGKYYLLPGVHEVPSQDYTIAMRTDVLTELGLPTPTTWDEFRTTLEAIKKAYPDSYPFSDRFSVPTPGGNVLGIASLAYGTNAGWAYQNATWSEDEGRFVVTGQMDEYKAMVEYFRELVEDGLMDPESFTQDDDTAIQKFASGKSFAISTNSQNIVNDYRPALSANFPDATVAKIPLPGGPVGHVVSATSKLENGLMISAGAAESPNFVAMMQFIDWLWYSDEGQEFAKWGVDDVTYTKSSDGSRTLAADVDMVGLNPGAPKHLQKDYGFSGGVFAYGGTKELVWSMFSDEERSFREEMATYDTVPLPPPWPLTESEREQATLLETALKDATSEATLQFILGQRDLSEWDAFVAELDGKGAQEYIEIVNNAQTRFAESND